MIYTITCNPSLDYVTNVPKFKEGEVNRSISEKIFVGGKGINVSLVLNQLGLQSTVLGFLAGFSGQEIERMVQEAGLHSSFTYLEKGFSRINVKLKGEHETELNGSGPTISAAAFAILQSQLEPLQSGDVLVLAGSVPQSLPSNTYEILMKSLINRNILVIVDATKDLLTSSLKYHPFLIKPNSDELEEIFDVKMDTEEIIIEHAKKLQTMGARNVLISRASKGAILVCETGDTYHQKAPTGKVRNSTGAGDSMVAGFITGYLRNKDYKEALTMGIASGSASAFSLGLATKEDINMMLETLKRGL